MKPDRLLATILKLIAAAEACALIGVLMPVALMRAAHAGLGLGEFPQGAVTPYLARCLSAFYVIHGGFVWIASRDVRKYAAFVTYIAISGAVFGVLVSVLDVMAAFPALWMVAEGPVLVALSVLFLVLQRRIAREERA